MLLLIQDDMTGNEKKEHRRALIGTIMFHGCLLILFLFLGLTYYEPKPEDGIIIHLEYSETGLGKKVNSARVIPTRSFSGQVPDESENNKSSKSLTFTQDVMDAPSLGTETSFRFKKENLVKGKNPAQEEEFEPSDKLNKLLQNVESSQESSQGEKRVLSNQGNSKRGKHSWNRNAGKSDSRNYFLRNRKVLKKPKPNYDCSDEGRVVVKVYVNPDGKVTRAIPGERIPNDVSSTSASSCLYNKAKAAALRTTWQADSKAPTEQVGYIIYNFQKR